mmetsp:Transcript_82710/g.221790  ORF Transcript_82710/g.221790 Transcript_82710/m.221790 type:complete len:230 (-) Transcript_82710:1611-2300(-)
MLFKVAVQRKNHEVGEIRIVTPILAVVLTCWAELILAWGGTAGFAPLCFQQFPAPRFGDSVEPRAVEQIPRKLHQQSRHLASGRPVDVDHRYMAMIFERIEFHARIKYVDLAVHFLGVRFRLILGNGSNTETDKGVKMHTDEGYRPVANELSRFSIINARKSVRLRTLVGLNKCAIHRTSPKFAGRIKSLLNSEIIAELGVEIHDETEHFRVRPIDHNHEEGQALKPFC